MVYTITIETLNGVTGASRGDSITLSPDATVGRVLDFKEGYYFYPQPNVDSNPKVKDTLSASDTIEIQTTMRNRNTDYDDLIAMLKNRIAGDSFRITVQRKTGADEVFTVVPNQGRVQWGSGEGEMREVTFSFRILGDYQAVS